MVIEKDHYENILALLIAKMVVKESQTMLTSLLFQYLHAWKKVG
jgi:hypothetical protein